MIQLFHKFRQFYLLENFFELKNLSNVQSHLGWLLQCLVGPPILLYLFRPTPFQFLIGVIVDMISLAICLPLERKILGYLDPTSNLYFDGIEKLNSELSEDQKTNLLKSILKLPKIRARNAYISSFFKLAPTTAIIVFYWDHERSNALQFGMTAGTFLITNAYFYGSVFLETHIYSSKLLTELHLKHNFQDTFKNWQISYQEKEFAFQEILTLIFIFIFMTSLQGLYIYSNQPSNLTQIVTGVSVIGFAALILFSRIWYLGRNYFFGALESLFFQMESVGYQKEHQLFALHTSPLIARFEQAFNSLVERLKVREQEMAALIMQEAEKGRFRALGEISGLVAHDMAGPLHAIQFWIDEMNELEPSVDQKRRIHYIQENIQQALELIRSLRARLKNSEVQPHWSSLEEAHFHVIRLLETQFGENSFGAISIQFDEKLSDCLIELPRVDLIQILDNIYRNSVTNLIQNQVNPAWIQITPGTPYRDRFSILIKDNGTGLTPNQFNQMTSYYFSKTESPSTASNANRIGLGLRLTRRLVEFHQGTLEVKASKHLGTTFELSFLNRQWDTPFLDQSESNARDIPPLIDHQEIHG